MKRKYFGDKRDIAKWMMLLQLAGKVNVKSICVVLFDQGDWEFGGEIVGGVSGAAGKADFPSAVADDIQRAVLDFYRPSLDCVRRLGRTRPPFRISLPRLPAWNTTKRGPYIQALANRLRDRRSRAGSTRRQIVFLDPDTGLAPAVPGLAHVCRDDVLQVWKAMGPGEWLVIYQHAPHRKEWERDARKLLGGWLRPKATSVWSLTFPKIAHDCALLCAKKP